MVVRRASVRSTTLPPEPSWANRQPPASVNIPVTTRDGCEADYSGSDAATHCARHTRDALLQKTSTTIHVIRTILPHELPHRPVLPFTGDAIQNARPKGPCRRRWEPRVPALPHRRPPVSYIVGLAPIDRVRHTRDRCSAPTGCIRRDVSAGLFSTRTKSRIGRHDELPRVVRRRHDGIALHGVEQNRPLRQSQVVQVPGDATLGRKRAQIRLLLQVLPARNDRTGNGMLEHCDPRITHRDKRDQRRPDQQAQRDHKGQRGPRLLGVRRYRA